ncbi:MAG TPA: FAD-dependent oxidoreductase, partial [Gemmatimonadaceae bacterium]|nr:FAD-dependent oxidoreductase [Gemmatimonadaceae bacterium]
MTQHASVAVIGCGVVGASIAYHLAKLGVRDVVVLDRGTTMGTGSTGRATGGYRAQFATPINVKLSLLSREKLRSFKDETGVDSGYEPVGYLWLAHND